MKKPSSRAAVLSAGECKRQSASTDRRLCDAALSVYSTLPTEAWRGFRPFPGGEIVFPDANLAREYLAAATHAAQVNRDPVGAIRLLDVSIRLDYIDVLETGNNLVQRVEAHSALGKDEPRRSILLYHLGCIFGRMKLWSAAGTVYRAAAELDPIFAWHLNNFAWMAATATDPRAHAGDLAVALAERACVISGYGCWCFLGTLAAAYARAGDFERAIAWQRVALALAPSEARDEEMARLHEFEAWQALVDHAPRPVGGDAVTDAEIAELDVQCLLQEARELMGAPPESNH